tara:strand:- start:28 stop:141 length:114 start_codon:yes stop_codon:yes gene_type:complete
MCECSKCKKDFKEAELTWILADGVLKLICDECKKEEL